MERSEKRPFKSMCSDLYITSADYLAELICFRKQKKENAGTLPIKFWNHPKFKNLYIREVSQARNLLKKYPVIAIIRALDTWEARFIMSLRNKNLIPIIESILPNITSGIFVEEEAKQETKSVPLPKKENILKRL